MNDGNRTLGIDFPIAAAKAAVERDGLRGLLESVDPALRLMGTSLVGGMVQVLGIGAVEAAAREPFSATIARLRLDSDQRLRAAVPVLQRLTRLPPEPRPPGMD